MKEKTDHSIKFDNNLSNLASKINQPLKLILHAGTPKSGTTSLQFFMSEHYEKLKSRGILYPKLHHNTYAPKHQWIVENMRNNDSSKLFNNFEYILSSVDEKTHTIFLSTEGIYNHWWDFSQESKKILEKISQLFETSLWIFFRDPVSFAESYYKQNIKNPKVPGIMSYGSDLSFEEMLNDKWFQKHFDYSGFVNECKDVLGTNSVEVFEYSKEIIQTVLNNLGVLDLFTEELPRENISLCKASIDMLRVANRYPLNHNEKGEIVSSIKKINNILLKYSTESCMSSDAKNRLNKLNSLDYKK